MKKHYSLLLAFLVAFSSFFVSCDENDNDSDSTICKITVVGDGDGDGAVSITNYIGTSVNVLIGNQVEVVATPAEGSVFIGWYMGNSNTPVSTEKRFVFTASENTTLIARFTKLSNLSNLTICSSAYGSVSFKDSSETSVAVLPGSEVTVVATPDENCDFIGWFVGDEETPVSTDAEYTFVVKENITLTAKFKFRTNPNGHEYVDLGLPSGLKWATCNVGATEPEEFGGYYAWGEVHQQGYYDWSTYKWCNGSDDTMTKYCTNSRYGTVDNKTVLDLEDDVAHVKWGGSWRMPTLDELKELKNNCTWIWTTQNGVNGYKVASKTNGNSIFLPAAGRFEGMYLNNSGIYGYYLSGSLYESGSCEACNLVFGSGEYGCDCYTRCTGLSVRPVSK